MTKKELKKDLARYARCQKKSILLIKYSQIPQKTHFRAKERRFVTEDKVHLNKPCLQFFENLF